MYKYSKKIYQVQEHQDINFICSKFNIDEKELTNLNRLSNNVISYGDYLVIPNQIKIKHTVLPKENLYSIANKYNVKVSYLMEKNNLKTENVFIGQRIII